MTNRYSVKVHYAKDLATSYVEEIIRESLGTVGQHIRQEGPDLAVDGLPMGEAELAVTKLSIFPGMHATIAEDHREFHP